MKQIASNIVFYEDSSKVANSKTDFFDNSELEKCPITKCILKSQDCIRPYSESAMKISALDFTI